jgi:hypothetical protein
MINVAVEGESDRETARRVVRAANLAVGKIVVAGGVSRLDQKIPKYHAASRQTPWVVFRDSDGVCPAELRRKLEPPPVPGTAFHIRIAHSMSEAWLLGDRHGFASYFRVPVNRVTADPDSLPHAKRAVIDLCGGSRSREVRMDMVATGGKVGPLYVSRLNDFASTEWDIDSAMSASDSLSRAVTRLREFAAQRA